MRQGVIGNAATVRVLVCVYDVLFRSLMCRVRYTDQLNERTRLLPSDLRHRTMRYRRFRVCCGAWTDLCPASASIAEFALRNHRDHCQSSGGNRQDRSHALLGGLHATCELPAASLYAKFTRRVCVRGRNRGAYARCRPSCGHGRAPVHVLFVLGRPCGRARRPSVYASTRIVLCR